MRALRWSWLTTTLLIINHFLTGGQGYAMGCYLFCSKQSTGSGVSPGVLSIALLPSVLISSRRPGFPALSALGFLIRCARLQAYRATELLIQNCFAPCKNYHHRKQLLDALLVGWSWFDPAAAQHHTFPHVSGMREKIGWKNKIEFET